MTLSPKTPVAVAQAARSASRADRALADLSFGSLDDALLTGLALALAG
ncbi:MAG: hypothetical protein HY000_39665 [Planctomycetes bacterium]|nr:hypothetical protein [Planctomycetota bacterium]